MDRVHAELPRLAFDNAVEKGFWPEPTKTGLHPEFGTVPPEVIGAKLLLVGTEVYEAKQAYKFGTDAEFLEELCDVVIRVADIFGYYGWDFGEATFTDYTGLEPMWMQDLNDYYDVIAGTAQAHRKGSSDGMRSGLNFMAWHISTGASASFGKGTLVAGIEAKMEVNRHRPVRHGRLY